MKRTIFALSSEFLALTISAVLTIMLCRDFDNYKFWKDVNYDDYETVYDDNTLSLGM